MALDCTQKTSNDPPKNVKISNITPICKPTAQEKETKGEVWTTLSHSCMSIDDNLLFQCSEKESRDR